MSSLSPEVPALNAFTRPLIEALSRHPKRIVFTEGEDLRVLKAAAQLVAAEAATPILLGNKERIRALAAEHGVKMTFINIIDPAKSSDFDLFCQRVTNMARYRDMKVGDAAEIVARPHYFGALMVQYGQADALVGGNQALPATLFRALIHTIKPVASVPKIFGAMVLVGDHLKHLGGSGVLFLADCAVEAGRVAQAGGCIEREKMSIGEHGFIAMAHDTEGNMIGLNSTQ